MEPVAPDRHKVVAGEPLGRLLGHHVKVALELRDEVVGRWGQLEFRVGILALVLPPRGIIHKMGAGDMPSAGRERHVSRTPPIADGAGAPQFPRPPVEGPIRPGSRGPKAARHKGCGRQAGQGLQGAGIELPDEGEPGQDLVCPGFALKRQGEARRQISP
jgi:hypothetical protein